MPRSKPSRALAACVAQALVISWIDPRAALGVDSNSSSSGPNGANQVQVSTSVAANPYGTLDLLRQALQSLGRQSVRLGGVAAPPAPAHARALDAGGLPLLRGTPKVLSYGGVQPALSNASPGGRGTPEPTLQSANPFLNRASRGLPTSLSNFAGSKNATNTAQGGPTTQANSSTPSSQSSQNQSLLTFTPPVGLGFSQGGLAGVGNSHFGPDPDSSQKNIAALISQAGAKYLRGEIATKNIIDPIDSGMVSKLSAAAKDPKAMEALIEELDADAGLWTGGASTHSDKIIKAVPGGLDAAVNNFLSRGIILVPAIGVGYTSSLPVYNGGPATPDRLGYGNYLAMMRAVTGAIVRRYGNRIWIWQIENEINVQAMDALSGFGPPRRREWSVADPVFTNRLMTTLGQSVHEEGRRLGRKLLTVTSFEGGLADAAGTVLPWTANPFVTDGTTLDILGVDEYPNYISGQPINTYEIGLDVQQAHGVAGGRQVWIVETGYPTAPTNHCFNLQNQAGFFQGAYSYASKMGADVVMAFGWLGPQTPSQVSATGPGGTNWFDFGNVEPHWSPLVATGNAIKYGPAWGVFKQAAASYASGNLGAWNNPVVGSLTGLEDRLAGIFIGGGGGLIADGICSAIPFFDALAGDVVGDAEWFGSTAYQDLLGFFSGARNLGSGLWNDTTGIGGFFAGLAGNAGASLNNAVGKPVASFFGNAWGGLQSDGSSIQKGAASLGSSLVQGASSLGSSIVSGLSSIF